MPKQNDFTLNIPLLTVWRVCHPTLYNQMLSHYHIGKTVENSVLSRYIRNHERCNPSAVTVYVLVAIAQTSEIPIAYWYCPREEAESRTKQYLREHPKMRREIHWAYDHNPKQAQWLNTWLPGYFTSR